MKFQLGQISRQWMGQTAVPGTCAGEHEWSIWGSCTRCGALDQRSWIIYTDEDGHHVAAIYVPTENERRNREEIEASVAAFFKGVRP